MKKNDAFEKISKSFCKLSFSLKKHSPEILLAGGIIGMVAAAIMACKATTKVGDVLEKTSTKIENIKKWPEADENQQESTIPKEDRTKALTRVYLQTGLEFVKLYGPAVAIGALSITSILASNNILKKRNIALAAAYLAVDKGFKEYRSRVIERFGEEVDRELKYNIRQEKIEKTVEDPETGKKKKVKETINVANPESHSPYARYFDKYTTAAWEKNIEYSLFFLKAQQKTANDLLISKGHLFLNEVYDMLGLERSVAGNIVGWTYDEKNPKGDNYVDFGILEVNIPDDEEESGYRPSILLDFNVDGDILHSGAIPTQI